MKSLTRSLINKLLFKGKDQKQFIPVRLSPNDITERVFFIHDGIEQEITWQHCIVCHDPFFIAVRTIRFDSGTIEIRNKAKVATRISVSLKRESTENSVFIYEITKTECFQLPYWHQYILLKRYFLRGKKDTFAQGMKYGAIYSFPRRVIAVSYKDDNYFNIFPMDFQCFVEAGNIIILGLRTTNTTLKKILATKKIVISDTTSVDLQVIYDLGRNHSAAPPLLDQLPFGVVPSEMFGFYVPDFSASYREFEIIESMELGTHTMMIGKLLNSKKRGNDDVFIHHIHFFEHVI